MGFSAKVLADSISPCGVRLTTLEVTMPRIVLAEFNTHRMLSRVSASSRAIPVKVRVAAVRADPFVPSSFGRNQKGMQAFQDLDDDASEKARIVWLAAAQVACTFAEQLAGIEVHKQLANRLLEPFSWHTVIVTATEWENFWGLRISKEAQPEIREPARLMKEAIAGSSPRGLNYGDWHLPLVPDYHELTREFPPMSIAKISAARCARVSYLTHAGARDPEEDLKMFQRLVDPGHMSPLEHTATPVENTEFCGNFRGWKQLRKFYIYEDNFSALNHG